MLVARAPVHDDVRPEPPAGQGLGHQLGRPVLLHGDHVEDARGRQQPVHLRQQLVDPVPPVGSPGPRGLQAALRRRLEAAGLGDHVLGRHVRRVEEQHVHQAGQPEPAGEGGAHGLNRHGVGGGRGCRGGVGVRVYVGGQEGCRVRLQERGEEGADAARARADLQAEAGPQLPQEAGLGLQRIQHQEGVLYPCQTPGRTCSYRRAHRRGPRPWPCPGPAWGASASPCRNSPHHGRAMVEGPRRSLSAVTLAPVGTPSFFECGLGRVEEALRQHLAAQAPCVLQMGELLSIPVAIHPLARFRGDPQLRRTVLLAPLLLLDADRQPVAAGELEPARCTVVLAPAAQGALVPATAPRFASATIAQLAALLQTSLAADGPTGVLLKGPAGSGKRTALECACSQLGLVLHTPTGLSRSQFDEQVTELSLLRPCCLQVGLQDYKRVRRLVARAGAGGPVVLAALHDGLDRPAGGDFEHAVDFGPADREARQQLLQGLVGDAAPLAAAMACTAGFGFGDLDRLGRLLAYRPAAARAAAVPEACKQIRSERSGHLGHIPRVTWDQVAGLEDAKALLRETLQAPAGGPFGRRKGLLLHGPPGTGKTLLAKAVATEYQMAFLAVKGPELVSMYIGETEANIRALFAQARLAQPAILFFDELDSLAAPRGQDGDSGGVADRVAAQLMVEMDRADEADVFVIGATNRPDLIEPALLRPGRLDRLVYLGVPQTAAERAAILRAASATLRLAPDVDFERLGEALPPNLSPADLAAVCRAAMRRALLHKIRLVEAGLGAGQDPVVHVGHDDFVQGAAL